MGGEKTAVAHVKATGPDASSSLPDLSLPADYRDTLWKRFKRGWTLEILGAMGGTALVAALMILLREYDRKPPPHLGHAFGSAVTLNTLVSFVSTVAKAMLLFAVAQCIGEQKWMYFMRRSRKLSTISTFDQASRGVSGGLNLIWETKAMNVATLGALCMIYAIAVDPLSQQLVSSTTHSVEGTSPTDLHGATVDYCHYWNDASPLFINPNFVNGTPGLASAVDSMSLSTKAAVLNGMYAKSQLFDVAPSCSSGNCTYEPFQSIAVCASVADVSSYLRFKSYYEIDAAINVGYDNFTNFWLEGYNWTFVTTDFFSMGLSNISTFMNSENPPSDWSELSIAFADYSNSSISDFYTIYYVGNSTALGSSETFDTINPGDYGASEINLRWCVQNFSASVTDGVASIQRLNTIDSLDGFSVDPNSAGSMRDYFNSVVGGQTVRQNIGAIQASTNFAQAMYEPFVYWPGIVTDPGDKIVGGGLKALDIRINNIATSLTNLFRTIENTNMTAPLPGTVWVEAPIVVIRWGWMSVPLTLVVFTWIFLLATMVGHPRHRENIWKSSSLAVMHALHPDLQRHVGGMDRGSYMWARDKRLMVRLVRLEGEGWRLVHDGEVEEEDRGVVQQVQSPSVVTDEVHSRTASLKEGRDEEREDWPLESPKRAQTFG